jgi:DtxR family Mn-dependent transcriptional regulator
VLASSTVENYLKAVFHAQSLLGDPAGLVPMGQIAAALGVVPGTATTMVKALAESGLVRYEPYVGARLTAAGEKLAALVLRRHRLVELFLVEIMGMSWAEVHDEAERLEHAVSDRLIERMDEMLGHPDTDPHGDPIPRPDGTIHPGTQRSLLNCPLQTPVVVSRVMDQNASFLRFVEESDLKPGQRIEVEARDEAADSVRVRHEGDRRVTLGARAASKLLVEVVTLAVLCGWLPPG